MQKLRLNLAFTVLCALSGCAVFRGHIHTKAGTQVSPPSDASSASTVNEDFSVDSITIPAGSKITVTQKAATSSAPSEKTTEITLSKDSVHKVENHITQASVAAPRAPDQTVALAKLDIAERRPVLYLALGLALAAGVLLYFQQRALAEIAGILSVIAFALWWVMGHEALLAWTFGTLAFIATAYFIYAEYRKAKIQGAADLATGTVKNIVQSVEEMAVDAPHAITTLKQDYLDPNLDASQKTLVAAIKPTIDTKYIQEAAAQKVSPPSA
jgi:hypothetical protein